MRLAKNMEQSTIDRSTTTPASSRTLHQSYQGKHLVLHIHSSFLSSSLAQHELLVSPCDFTSLAVVADVDAVQEEAEGDDSRWLLWVEKRRGILGCKRITCPRPEIPRPASRPSHEPDSTSKQRYIPLLTSPKRTGSAKMEEMIKGGDINTGQSDTEDVAHSQVTTDSPQQNKEERILLDGLNQPLKIAIAAVKASARGTNDVHDSRHQKGCFILENGNDSSNISKSCAKQQTKNSLQPSKRRQCMSNGSGRICYLQWGKSSTIVVTEGLINPIGLFVTSQLDVYILAEKEFCQSENQGDQDCGMYLKKRGDEGLVCRRSLYHVLFLHGSQVTKLLCENGDQREEVGEELRSLSPLSGYTALSGKGQGSEKIPRERRSHDLSQGQAKWYCKDRGIGCKDKGARTDQEDQARVGQKEEMKSSEEEKRSDTDDTDWESSGSDEKSADLRVTVKFRSNTKKKQQQVLEPCEVLTLPGTTTCGMVEQPVDLCVLENGTIIIAFRCKASPETVICMAPVQGLMRAYCPQKKILAGCQMLSLPSTPELEKHQCHQDLQSVAFDHRKSYIIKQGLPVITGIALGLKGMVFISMCGAANDGTTTAIAAIQLVGVRTTLDPNVEGGVSPPLMNEGRFVRDEERFGEGVAAMRRGNSKPSFQDSFKEPSSVIPIVSGFCSAAAVDALNNLFYVTANREGECHALWCHSSGACLRRLSSIQCSATVMRIPVVDKVLLHNRGPKNVESSGGPSRQRGVVSRDVILSAALAEEGEKEVVTGGQGVEGLFASRGKRESVEFATSPSEFDAIRGAQGEEEEGVNIVVVARCRPLIRKEVEHGVRAAVRCTGKEVTVAGDELPLKRERSFMFDRVFGPYVSQACVYAEAVAPVVHKVLDGYNSTVFAYGQTGSGKTHTMEGGLGNSDSLDATENNRSTPSADVAGLGMMPRAVHTVFGMINNAVGRSSNEDDDRSNRRVVEGEGHSRRHWVYISHMEIYNERIYDLLSSDHEEMRPSPVSTTTPMERSSPKVLSPKRSRPVVSPPSPNRHHYRGFKTEEEEEKGGTDASSPRGRSAHPSLKLSMDTENLRPSTPSPRRGGNTRGLGLKIEEHPELGVHVRGLTQVEVQSPAEIFAIMARSKYNRRTAETMCNSNSSRSHGIFCMRVISSESTPWGGEIVRDGRLSLVDLSGSENIKRSGAEGARAEEAAAIGQSLLALGRVIKALVRKAPHVPYRESKLTRVLADSLGGNALTTVILNITPNHKMLDETLSTLSYAKMAQRVENIPIQSKVCMAESTNKVPTEGGEIASRTHQTKDGQYPLNQEKFDGPVRPWEAKVPIRTMLDIKKDKYSPARPTGQMLMTRKATQTLQVENIPSQKLDQSDVTSCPMYATKGVFSVLNPTVSSGDSMHDCQGRKSSTSADPHEDEESLISSQVGHESPLVPTEAREAEILGQTSNSVKLTPFSHLEPPRIFDRTAVLWIQSTVIELSPTDILNREESWAKKGQGLKGRDIEIFSSGNRGKIRSRVQVQNGKRCPENGKITRGSVRLRPVARVALLEIFGRYDKNDYGFLSETEVETLQLLWKEKKRKENGKGSHIRPDSAFALGLCGNLHHGKTRQNTQAQRRLTSEAFLTFVREAALRDAIFVRHLFLTCGYTLHLTLRRDICSRNGSDFGAGVARSHHQDKHKVRRSMYYYSPTEVGGEGSSEEEGDRPPLGFVVDPRELFDFMECVPREGTSIGPGGYQFCVKGKLKGGGLHHQHRGRLVGKKDVHTENDGSNDIHRNSTLDAH